MKIEGKNAVLEALKGQNITADSLLVQKGENSQITRLAREMGVKTQFVDKQVLDKSSENGKHQGYILTVSDFEYCEIEDIITGKTNPLVVVLDEIYDPHNLGSIMRVCECAGVDGIIISKNRQVQVNDTAVRVSAGAAAYVKVARVVNINRAIEQLKEANIWVYAADMDGQSMYKTDLTGGVAIVVGSEGKGVSRLTRQSCDGVLSIPMSGNVNSLNASVACGIVVYEAVRQRKAINNE